MTVPSTLERADEGPAPSPPAEERPRLQQCQLNPKTWIPTRR